LYTERTTPSPLALGNQLSSSKIHHDSYPSFIARTLISLAPYFAELSPRRGDCRALGQDAVMHTICINAFLDKNSQKYSIHLV
jgi:hypothetical protein